VIEENGTRETDRAFGLDSFQALQMAIEGARVKLDKRGQYTQFESDPKGGPGIARHIPTNMDRLFEARVILAIERESKAHYDRVAKRRQLDVNAIERVVKERRKILASLEQRIIEQKKFLADWRVELKKWDPSKTVLRASIARK